MKEFDDNVIYMIYSLKETLFYIENWADYRGNDLNTIQEKWVREVNHKAVVAKLKVHHGRRETFT